METVYTNAIKAVAVLIIGSLCSLAAKRLIGIVLNRLVSKTKSETDDYIVNILVSSIKPIGFIVTATLAWKILPIQEDIDQIVLGIAKLFSLIIIVRIINRIVIRVIHRWSVHINDLAVSSMLKSLSPMVRASIWCIGFVFYLQNMGVQMAAIWAILSAGGIGAGLALKDPVQEFFEYITILLDKPFQSGQFIHVDGVWATVERVGVRSTRLRSLDGEIIVMSNSSLTNSKISNYAEMENRRLVHKLGVTYDTPVQTMIIIPELLQKIVNSTENARFDRCHFVEFGNSSLNFELVYYIPTSNYKSAMMAQQTINIEIMKAFEEKNIEFAYPTQTINIANKDSLL